MDENNIQNEPSEDIEPQIELVDSGGDVGGEVTPPVDINAILEQERSTWTGRLSKAQSVIAAVDSQLAQYGLKIDEDSGQLIPATTGLPIPAPTYTPQQFQPTQDAADDFDDEAFYESPTASVKRIVDEAVSQAISGLQQHLQPIIQTSAEAALAQRVPEWQEYGNEIKQIAAEYGADIIGLANNPQVLKLVVDAAKGRKLSSPVAAQHATPPPKPVVDDSARQARLATAAQTEGVGSAPGTPGVTKLTPEQAAEAERFGLTEEEYLMIEEGGPVTVNPAWMQGGRR